MITLLACVESPAPEEEVLADEVLELGDENNFVYEGVLDAPSFPMAEVSDATLSWPSLTTDLQCHSLDPVADIDNTALLVFPYLSEEEVEDGLSLDTLEQVDLGVYLSYEPGDTTSVGLSQFTFFSTDPEIEGEFVEGSGSWLVLLTTGTQIAVGARMLAFITPTAGETSTTGELTDGCPVLDFEADLGVIEPVPALVQGPWQLDWTSLTRVGNGGDFVTTRADSLMVARFDITLEELEASFLDIETLAAESWTWPLTGGTTADLGELSGGEFPGFFADGLWMLALRCSSCPNPAPLFLTVIAPE